MTNEQTLEALKKANPALAWHSALDERAFRRYGSVVAGYDFAPLIDYLRSRAPLPESGNLYVADDRDAHLPVIGELSSARYGGMPLESGYCNGHNQMLDGLEYHRGSEIDVAATECVLLLSTIFDIEDGKLDSSRVEAFYVPEGAAVELYATTLHFSPCRVRGEGFRVGVILPMGTNTPLDTRDEREPTLRLRNKWLLAHQDCARLTGTGAYPGIYGENYRIQTIG